MTLTTSARSGLIGSTFSSSEAMRLRSYVCLNAVNAFWSCEYIMTAFLQVIRVKIVHMLVSPASSTGQACRVTLRNMLLHVIRACQ